MVKFFKKKEVKAEVKTEVKDEVKTEVKDEVKVDTRQEEELKRIISGFKARWKSHRNSWKDDLDRALYKVVEWDCTPTCCLINSVVLKYQREFKTASQEKRGEILNELSSLLGFMVKYSDYVFEYNCVRIDWNHTYLSKERVLFKRAIKFLAPEIKEYKNKYKTK